MWVNGNSYTACIICVINSEMGLFFFSPMTPCTWDVSSEIYIQLDVLGVFLPSIGSTGCYTVCSPSSIYSLSKSLSFLVTSANLNNSVKSGNLLHHYSPSFQMIRYIENFSWDIECPATEFSPHEQLPVYLMWQMGLSCGVSVLLLGRKALYGVPWIHRIASFQLPKV